MQIKKFESLEEANKWLEENKKEILIMHGPLICHIDVGVLRELVYISYEEVK